MLHYIFCSPRSDCHRQVYCILPVHETCGCKMEKIHKRFDMKFGPLLEGWNDCLMHFSVLLQERGRIGRDFIFAWQLFNHYCELVIHLALSLFLVPLWYVASLELLVLFHAHSLPLCLVLQGLSLAQGSGCQVITFHQNLTYSKGEKKMVC